MKEIGDEGTRPLRGSIVGFKKRGRVGPSGCADKFEAGGAVMMKDTAMMVCRFMVVCLGLVATSQAQPPKGAAPAPVPPQVGAAKRVFIANAGGANFETVFSEIAFSGGPDRAYDQFYAAMKNWGHYEIVPSPADADLILKVRWLVSDTGLKLPILGEVGVEVIDPKTTMTLWNFGEYVRGALLLGNRDKNFDRALNAVVERMKKLVEAPASGSEDPAR
jgi:hypothetical protein